MATWEKWVRKQQRKTIDQKPFLSDFLKVHQNCILFFLFLALQKEDRKYAYFQGNGEMLTNTPRGP